MIDLIYWRAFFWHVFALGPFVLILANCIVFNYFCRRHLEKMLEALKTSPGFVLVHTRGIEHLGFSSRAGLLLSIGYALARPSRGIVSGKLDKAEVEHYPLCLRYMALTSLSGMVLNGLWLAMWIVTLLVGKPVLALRLFDGLLSLSFMFYASPFILLAVAYGLVVFITRYHLPTMIDAIGLSHPYRSEHSVLLERIVFRERYHLISGVGLAVLFNGRRMGRLNLHDFELESLPARFKWLALLSAISLYIGVLWLIVSAVVLKFFTS